MVTLGCTNKAACGVKLHAPYGRLVCGCFCALLNTQRLFLCASGWFDPPSASHLAQHQPHPPPTHSLLIDLIRDIGGVQKKCPAVLAR